MTTKGKKNILILVIVTLIIIGILLYFFYNKEDNRLIKNTTEINSNVNLDNDDEEINWESLKEENLNLTGKSVTISNAGIYNLSGSIDDGSIIINTDDDVKLVLDNVNIKSNDGPAIVIESANNTVIELKQGSLNKLEDSKTYSNSEYEGCIFSKDDLILQGTGTLNIVSNYLDGIVSKDDLKIIDGTYVIDSNDDGIRGKDSVYIVNGNFTINSKADAIKSTNDTDAEKGYINIENGTFNINSGEDGFQAETKLVIYNGEFNITTSDGSSSVSSAIGKGFGGYTNYDSTSSKALKSVDNLVIKSGTFNIDSKDDAIHSNNYVGIESGTINISSGDDGIHADEQIVIDGGKINITKSYEGIEANDITINNGNISVVSNDDGINISGGNDSSSMGGRPGQNTMSSSSGTLTINGGNIYVNADGDGLDSNGNIIMNDGVVYIDGPTNNGNGALDYDSTFDINGGTFVATGSSGMAQTLSTSSKQYSLMFNLSNSYSAKKITITDESDNEIISYSPSKSYSSIVVSTSKITKNKTYTLKIDGNKVTSLTASSVSSSSGAGIMNRPGQR